MEKHLLSPLKTKASFLLKNKWVREFILIPTTISGKRKSNKTEDYGVFNDAKVSHCQQVSFYVSNLEKSRDWYEKLLEGSLQSRITLPEVHPLYPDRTIRCCFISTKQHPECLVLIEQKDRSGNIIKPSTKGFHHFAFELTGKTTTFQFAREAKKKGFKPNYGPAQHNNNPPHGDGESGGNIAVYFYDPDYHNIEFFSDMDTKENYIQRYGNKKR